MNAVTPTTTCKRVRQLCEPGRKVVNNPSDCFRRSTPLLRIDGRCRSSARGYLSFALCRAIETGMNTQDSLVIYHVVCVLYALALAGCASPQESGPVADQAEQALQEAKGERERFRQVAATCHNAAIVSTERLLQDLEWSAALGFAYDAWLPEEADKMDQIFERLASCAQGRELLAHLSSQTAGRYQKLGFGQLERADADAAPAVQRIRDFGDAIRCLRFLKAGLMEESISPSCLRLSSGSDDLSEQTTAGYLVNYCAQPPPASEREQLSSSESSSAPGSLSLGSEDDSACVAPSFQELPMGLKTNEAAFAIQILGRSRDMLTAMTDVDDDIPLPNHRESLTESLSSILARQRVRLPVTPEYFERPRSLQLPTVPAADEQRWSQSGISFLFYFSARRSYVTVWPALGFDENLQRLSLRAPEKFGHGEGYVLRDAGARSVSPNRVDPVSILSASERLSDVGLPHAGDAAHRALVLAHRTGVWGGLRPALCAARDLGIWRLQFLARSQSDSDKLVSVPLYSEEITSGRGGQQVVIEAREDGFLVVLPNGDRRAFPFVEGDVYAGLYRFLRGINAGSARIRADARVEIQIIALLASVLATDRGPLEEATTDRELLRAPATSDGMMIRIAIELSCELAADSRTSDRRLPDSRSRAVL